MTASSSRGPIRCTDCTAVVDAGGRLDHDLTCPRGLDMEATGAADARWFRQHPGQVTRRRPMVWSECELMAANELLPEGYTCAGMVWVRQLAPGILSRSFDEVWVVRRGTDR